MHTLRSRFGMRSHTHNLSHSHRRAIHGVRTRTLVAPNYGCSLSCQTQPWRRAETRMAQPRRRRQRHRTIRVARDARARGPTGMGLRLASSHAAHWTTAGDCPEITLPPVGNAFGVAVLSIALDVSIVIAFRLDLRGELGFAVAAGIGKVPPKCLAQGEDIQVLHRRLGCGVHDRLLASNGLTTPVWLHQRLCHWYAWHEDCSIRIHPNRRGDGWCAGDLLQSLQAALFCTE